MATVNDLEQVDRVAFMILTTLYWHVGQRIRQDILKQKRADYGEQIRRRIGAAIGTRVWARIWGKSRQELT